MIRIINEVLNKDVLGLLETSYTPEQKDVATAAIDKYHREKSKLLKADLIKIIEDIIPIVE